jgi:hypothetical protein
MFKNTAAGLVALTYLSKDAQAVKFRPPTGSVPWHKEGGDIEETSWAKPDWPVNYFVPDFGADQDVIDTKQDLKVSEKSLKKKMHASFKADKEHGNYAANPRNYFVPNFG